MHTRTPPVRPTTRASGAPTTTTTATARPTPPPTPSPAPSPSPTVHPTSTAVPLTAAPAYAHYDVGAYYFSGWSHAQNNNITAILTGKERSSEPLIGWYDDTQAQVDKNINQAANAGIDFWAFDWYDIARSPYLSDKTLNEGLGLYLTSPIRRRLKFCIDFIDQNPFIPRAKDWPTLVHYWMTHYFNQPDYERVNGKPLFIVFSPEHMRDIFGSSQNVRQAITYLRAQAHAAGLPGVEVVVSATVAPRANPYHVLQLNMEGYDAATGYNYHAMGGEQYRVPVPYQRLVDENVAMWNRVAAGVHVPYIPVVTSGWDQRYSIREQQTAIIYDGRTPQKVACFALQARHWIDTHPDRTVKEHIVMLFAWNEIGEGGELIPDHHDGYAYANAVRAVFGGPGSPPTTPAYCHA